MPTMVECLRILHDYGDSSKACSDSAHEHLHIFCSCKLDIIVGVRRLVNCPNFSLLSYNCRTYKRAGRQVAGKQKQAPKQVSSTAYLLFKPVLP